MNDTADEDLHWWLLLLITASTLGHPLSHVPIFMDQFASGVMEAKPHQCHLLAHTLTRSQPAPKTGLASSLSVWTAATSPSQRPGGGRTITHKTATRNGIRLHMPDCPSDDS